MKRDNGNKDILAIWLVLALLPFVVAIVVYLLFRNVASYPMWPANRLPAMV